MDRLGLFPVRALLAIVVLLVSVGTAAAAELPLPPCAAAAPFPDYASPGAPPNLRVWNSGELSVPWIPPACTGWTAKSGGVLVALAGRFSYRGSVDGLLARFGAISALAGIQYWSVTGRRLAYPDHPCHGARRTGCEAPAGRLHLGPDEKRP